MSLFAHLRHPDRLFAIVVIAVAAVMYVISGTLTPPVSPGGISASTYPKFILGCIIFTSGILIGRTADDSVTGQKMSLRGIPVVILTVLYIVSIEPVGFFIVTPVFLYLLPVLIGFRRHLVNLASVAINTALIYLIFVKTLSIPLPPGLLGD